MASKPVRKNPRMDGVAWLLFFCGIVLALCILSHEPAAGTSSAQNLLGYPGHWLANELYETLGSAVYAFLAAWLVLVLMLLVRKSWLRWTGRFVGWVSLIPCTAVAFDFIGKDWLPGPNFGSGGALGSVLRDVLHERLPGMAGLALYTGVTFLAILLAADFVVRAALSILYGVCYLLTMCVILLVQGPQDTALNGF